MKTDAALLGSFTSIRGNKSFVNCDASPCAHASLFGVQSASTVAPMCTWQRTLLQNGVEVPLTCSSANPIIPTTPLST